MLKDQTAQVRDDKNTDRDHEDNAYDISLISWFRVIQEMPVDMKYGQTNGSNSTQKCHDIEIKWYQIRHSAKEKRHIFAMNKLVKL